MRIFKYRQFQQWAKSEKIDDIDLVRSINEMNCGLINACLGGGLFKKRIAKKGKGKSRSYRTILAFKHYEKAIFIYGFAKNERDNLSDKEEIVYKKLANYFIKMTDKQISTLVSNGELFEVTYEKSKGDEKKYDK